MQQKGFESFTRESLKPINDLVVDWKNRYSSVDEICVQKEEMKEEMKEVVEHIKKMEEELDC